MQNELNANASTAGSLFSSSVFEVPPFQREYSWTSDEVREFFNDIQGALDQESYFLGLVIITEKESRRQIVDGQQRIVTLSLLAAALYHEAKNRGREALADRLQADFLRSIDYATDETDPRVILTDPKDNETLQDIIDHGSNAKKAKDAEGVSAQMRESFELVSRSLAADLASDPFKRLGKWTEFITHKLYFAVFAHPDPATVYSLFEVINTRGRDLTTADLLKNYILSQVKEGEKLAIYKRWQDLAGAFPSSGSTSYVQFIRHAVTVESGHVLPRDLFAFLAGRNKSSTKEPPTAYGLLDLLESRFPLYSQIVDPALSGPADDFALRVFLALNQLNVITVRPLMMAISDLPNPREGLEYVLKLVVRRMVVGTLGTGNIERRFSDAAKRVFDDKTWTFLETELADLNPSKDDFINQLKRRSFNKGILTFLRSSIIGETIAPSEYHTLHFILPRTTTNWPGFSDDERSIWVPRIGNTLLSNESRRPEGALTWKGVKEALFPTAIDGEWTDELAGHEAWNVEAVRSIGERLAETAGNIWYD
ncbi:hypothetical protein BN1012_Phect2939 [Candidatus Phaeomarinobacter ectocarpi]|uniref:GmrSD restriction endonucleases N-terminal domain-containing protein n=1 Tax=Candidatus Phaeomarinibacter ectocarpi TaxID=1458461 RepID=X5MP96_9HYPH|nr:DUF262 domain-containing protein [Candidatus Phaeomarinobacter ectocarpi]CDO61151.1 hypothetical protein BN1012_Phect2939 [Candidatus Phaeomarinobacter ectocarpi]